MNGGRGLDVLLEHDTLGTTGSPGVAETVSNWFIGRGDTFNTAALTNQFNENSREGIVIDVQATAMDQDTVNVAANFPHYAQTDINNDVFVETNLPQGYTSGGANHPSTQHPLISDGVDGGGGAIFTDIDPTTVHLTANVEVVNTEIANNGGFGGFEDGLVLAVGALTRMNAEIANASFGGNVGDDIAIYPQRSNELNPPNSFQDNANDGAHSFMVYDPVAYIDVVFGVADTDQDGTPDTTAGNGNAAVSGTGGTGNGDQVRFTRFGATTTNVITNGGIFTNADPVKGGNRSVELAGIIYDSATGLPVDIADDVMVNDFFQNGVQQDVNALFGSAAVNWVETLTPGPVESLFGESY